MPKEEITKILNNKLTHETKYCNISKCYKLKKGNKYIKLKGITKLLKEIFYPNYEYVRDKYSKSTGVSNSWEGKNRGSLIHRQLRDFFNLPLKKFSIKHENLHTYTKKAIISLHKWDMIPIKAELSICDPNEIIGTGIDGICSLGKKLVFLDWKTGYDGYIEKGNDMMKDELSFLSNCPKNQAFLQMIVEREIVKRNYGVVPDDMYVIQLSSDGVSSYKVPDRFLSLGSIIYEKLIKYKRAKKVKSKQKS